MREGDHCGLCDLFLEAACRVDRDFCDLKETYYTTDMSADEMWDRAVDLTESPEQRQRIEGEMDRLARSGWVPAPRRDRGQEAAQRWLDHYRHGRED